MREHVSVYRSHLLATCIGHVICILPVFAAPWIARIGYGARVWYGIDQLTDALAIGCSARCPLGARLNSFQTTLTPNLEKLYKYYSVTKQEETWFWMCSVNAVKFQCRWSGNRWIIDTGRNHRFVLSVDTPWELEDDWVTGLSGKPACREMRRACGSAEATAIWSLSVMQIGSLPHRSHWSQYAAAFPDISFLDDPVICMRGLRKTVELLLFEISNSMKTYPSVFHAYTSQLRPAIAFFMPKHIKKVSNRIPPTPHWKKSPGS